MIVSIAVRGNEWDFQIVAGISQSSKTRNTRKWRDTRRASPRIPPFPRIPRFMKVFGEEPTKVGSDRKTAAHVKV
jgi:hypothetical protein